MFALLFVVSWLAVADGFEGVLEPEPVAVWEGESLKPRVPTAWAKLRGRIGSVCVCGDDRIGKSTLLTLWGQELLQRKDFQFPAGHTRESHTKGIWSSVLSQHDTGLPFHVNLCDSQGLKTVDGIQEARLFSTNVLLPSVVVYMLYNVIQNDQIRDLTRMAQQFQELTAMERGRFSHVLSPHLILVVREVSDLDGINVGRNLTMHLEDVLNSPVYQADKSLIRQVFLSREAWRLDELPREARMALRAGAAGKAPGDEGWREAGREVLDRVLGVLSEREADLPDGGPELAQWLRDVTDTVNSQQGGAMGRLVGHGERLASGRWWRRNLDELRDPAIGLTLGIAAAVTFTGVVNRWLDRAAFCAWVALCVWCVGTSSLVTTPLSGVAPQYCERICGSGAMSILLPLCREVSGQTASMLLAGALGALSYPLVTGQLRWVLAMLHLPPNVCGAGAIASLAVMSLCCSLADSDAVVETSDRTSFIASLTLLFIASVSGVELWLRVCHNRSCKNASAVGRAAHVYATRTEEVQELTNSDEWLQHYRSHDVSDAIWRFRCLSLRGPATDLAIACVLLAWAAMIYPHCDSMLAAGIMGSLAHLAWNCGVVVTSLQYRFASQLEVGAACMTESEHDSESSVDAMSDHEDVLSIGKLDNVNDAVQNRDNAITNADEQPVSPEIYQKRRSSRAASPPPVLSESKEERRRRDDIEAMRRSQEAMTPWRNRWC